MNRCRITGKVEYATAQDGWTALKRRTDARARATHQHIHHGGHVYRCEDCGRWHLTRATNRHAPSYWPQFRKALHEQVWQEREREAWA